MTNPRPELPHRESVLVVDDVASNLDLLVDLLEPRGYDVLVASRGEEAVQIATVGRPDLILLDVLMPGANGYEICRRLKEKEATAAIPVIFITARGDTASLVEGFRAGGVDYLTKPFHPDEILIRVQTHLGVYRLTRELRARTAELIEANARLTQEIDRRCTAEAAFADADGRLSLLSEREAERWGLAAFIGRSPTVRAILEAVRRVQSANTTSVLVAGESGTGKELVARAIHFGSSRAKYPFVPVNCSAIPPDLAESMFFGHRRGSFTGADRDRKGYFELAHRGTLFLDEMGEMPAGLQAKLLRVLESGAFTGVGAEREQHADVRIVAATNADLHQRIREGRFRADLYYRIARFTVRTPPLRERREDVPLLAEHFLRLIALEMGRKPPTLRADALAALTQYDFPGNVRELKNVVERALIESGGGEIRPEHLAFADLTPVAAMPTSRADLSQLAEDLPLNLEAAERALIERALALTRGNVTQAARMLGIPRMRIYRRVGAGAGPTDPT